MRHQCPIVVKGLISSILIDYQFCITASLFQQMYHGHNGQTFRLSELPRGDQCMFARRFIMLMHGREYQMEHICEPRGRKTERLEMPKQHIEELQGITNIQNLRMHK